MIKDNPDYIIMTPYIRGILERVKIYSRAGLPVHLTGPAGTGKTTLALKLAKDLGSEYYLIQGDEAYNRNDLVGGPFGYYQKVVEDNFISTVSKIERKLTPIWVDNPVAIACRRGAILIYDEFTRSRPETNNLLLGIISEKMIMVSDHEGRLKLENVHPKFSLILTSNPQEYTGVNKAQDALIDRIVTVKLSGYDEETETLIVAKHADLNNFTASRLVRFVRKVKNQLGLTHSTLRAAIMLGKVFGAQFLYQLDKELFFQCCLDLFGLEPKDLKRLKEIWNEEEVTKSGFKEK